MFLKKYKLYPVILFSLFSFPQLMHAQTDSLFLTVDQLFERGVQYSLQLQADAMKESMAQERMRTARSAQLPELQIGLKGGFVGQPVVWERGLSAPLYPDAPDWSQNYAIDLAHEKNIPVQESVRKGGGTNAGITHRYNIPTIIIGIPVRFAHASFGICSEEDYDNAVKLAVEIITNIDAQTIRGF